MLCQLNAIFRSQLLLFLCPHHNRAARTCACYSLNPIIQVLLKHLPLWTRSHLHRKNRLKFVNRRYSRRRCKDDRCTYWSLFGFEGRIIFFINYFKGGIKICVNACVLFSRYKPCLFFKPVGSNEILL